MRSRSARRNSRCCPVGQTYIELLEGLGPESGVTEWINKKGTGLFHICFEVDDIEGAIAELKAKNVKLQSETWRTAMAGRRSCSSTRPRPAIA